MLALLIAVPISLGTALFLAELAPRWLRDPLSFLVELLAAVPSIVYGLWGIFVLIPLLRPVELWLSQHLRFLPIFRGAPLGYGHAGGRPGAGDHDHPLHHRRLARSDPGRTGDRSAKPRYALGATQWETMRGPVLRFARVGIMGGIILGLGRALGETMAVTMVIGNSSRNIPTSLFDQAYTLPSLLANEFNDSNGGLHTASLVAAALILLLITFVVNGIARVDDLRA